MTRHQVWKARERARFRVVAEWARVQRSGVKKRKLLVTPEWFRYNDACLDLLSAKMHARQRGIKEPFLG